MKALMKTALGVGNLALCEIAEPHPSAGQVKIRVIAAGLCGTDLHIYHDEFRSAPPVTLGHEVAGEIVAVGEGVTQHTVGERVTTETYFSTCGVCRYCRSGHINLCLQRKSIGSFVNGGFAEYVIVPEVNLHTLPDSISFEAGALTEPLACVVNGVINMGTVMPGDLAVVAGPGAIGLLTVQVLIAAGASVIVLGTDQDTYRLDLARKLGALAAVNAQQQNPTELVKAHSIEGLGADVVYECAGAGAAAAQLIQLVRRRGRYVQIGLVGKPIMYRDC